LRFAVNQSTYGRMNNGNADKTNDDKKTTKDKREFHCGQAAQPSGEPSRH